MSTQVNGPAAENGKLSITSHFLNERKASIVSAVLSSEFPPATNFPGGTSTFGTQNGTPASSETAEPDNSKNTTENNTNQNVQVGPVQAITNEATRSGSVRIKSRSGSIIPISPVMGTGKSINKLYLRIVLCRIWPQAILLA